MPSKKRRKHKTPHSPKNHTNHYLLAQTKHPNPAILEGELCASTYDETLLERTRTQWQFGDWDSLIKLEQENIQHHPERSKLALFAAAGHMQAGDIEIAQQLIQQAQEWGCDKPLLTRILVAGVHNSLGRAAALLGEQEKMTQHFEASVASGSPGNDLKLLVPARINLQLEQLGLKEATQTPQLSHNFQPQLPNL